MSCGATLATQMDSQRLLLGIGAPFDAPREHLAAQAAHSEVIRKITIRYQPGLTPADRTNHEDRDYELSAELGVHRVLDELALMVRA